VLFCIPGSGGVSGTSSDQPGSEDAAGEGIPGIVHAVLHAQGSDAASSTAQPV